MVLVCLYGARGGGPEGCGAPTPCKITLTVRIMGVSQRQSLRQRSVWGSISALRGGSEAWRQAVAPSSPGRCTPVARPVYARHPAGVRSSPDQSTPVARSGDDGADASKNALPLSRDGVRQGCEWVVAVGDTAIRGRGSAAAWALQGLSAWPCGPRTRCKSLRRNRPRRCLRRQGCECRCGRGTSGRG